MCSQRSETTTRTRRGAHTFCRITASISHDNGKTEIFLSHVDERTPTAGLWEPFMIHPRCKEWRYYAAENSASDQDILMRSSTNNGATWSAATTVAGGGTTGWVECLAARISTPQAARRGFYSSSTQRKGQHHCSPSSRSSAATMFRGEHRSMRQPELAIPLAWRSSNCTHVYGNSGRIVHDRRGAFGEERLAAKAFAFGFQDFVFMKITTASRIIRP
ncbi:Glycoside hydrolase family 93 protein [Mycena indigotica]|uniref:Glycoside hydrolase family 93 protein n=1 Tax=Mycena indigotica TaxID=2126181 RepID=A0A8H6RWR7_9AGAR|nr:Glycoside hydrolase family 93 protein [Mycena indigotica]KAF7288739.1 Glycoside hydrolase family 93 protein [Mycena indigotica]